jgi:nucleoside-diphosphate-sugar epimerase
MNITSEEQLEDILATPSPEDVAAVDHIHGDLAVLGVGGKMGPSLAIRAKRAILAAGAEKRVYGVSRFSEPGLRDRLDAAGIETIEADLLDFEDYDNKLPDAQSIIFMAGRKFGSTGGESLTWAMNTLVPAYVARRYRFSSIVAFSSGNVYPFVPASRGGATESSTPAPVGEYAQSVLGRERVFEYYSRQTPIVLLRLNYAVDLRYGVLLDIGTKVFERRPVDVTMGLVNVIWQGDANSVGLRAFTLCDRPAAVLNLAGPETLSVRYVAQRFGEYFGVQPQLEGAEAENALLNNAAKCHRIFGYPRVSVDQVIEWTAQWIGMGGTTLGKPTHFEVRDGKF